MIRRTLDRIKFVGLPQSFVSHSGGPLGNLIWMPWYYHELFNIKGHEYYCTCALASSSKGNSSPHSKGFSVTAYSSAIELVTVAVSMMAPLGMAAGLLLTLISSVSKHANIHVYGFFLFEPRHEISNNLTF